MFRGLRTLTIGINCCLSQHKPPYIPIGTIGVEHDITIIPILVTVLNITLAQLTQLSLPIHSTDDLYNLVSTSANRSCAFYVKSIPFCHMHIPLLLSAFVFVRQCLTHSKQSHQPNYSTFQSLILLTACLSFT